MQLPGLPDISTLPVEQQIVAWIVFVLISTFVVLTTRANIAKGKNDSTNEATHAPIAAVIVDPAPLNRATAAVEAFSMTQVQTNMNITAQTVALVDLTKEIRELAKQVEILGIVADRRSK